MFISRLYLKNFIGIKSGTGLNEIEINFPRNGKTVTMIRGGNGSGKSTILSMLTPFKKSFDARDKTLVLSGLEGIKEIDFEDNGHVYKIKHIIPGPGCNSKSASFITKDGVEQNDAGLVTQFEEYIKSEFKVDKEYFKVGKIGANIENFVNLTTAERKLYIASFVEEVKKYIDAYNVVSDKYKLNENQIKQISADLKKLENIETVKTKITQYEEQLVEVEKTLENLNKDLVKVDLEISKVSKDMALINYVETKSTADIKSASLKKNYQINEKFKRLYKELNTDECEKTVKDLEDKLDTLQSEKSKLDGQIQAENKTLLDIENELKKINVQLNNKAVINIDDLKKEINEFKAEMQKFENVMNTNDFVKKIYNCEKSVVYLDSFKSFITTILSKHDVLNQYTIDTNKTNAALFFNDDFASVYNSFSKNIATCINNNRTLLEETNAEFNKKSANTDKLAILEKRPHECKIDACPFIKDALQYKNLQSELESLQEKANAVKASLENNEEKLDALRDVKASYSAVANAYVHLNPRENIVYKYFIGKYGKLIDIISLPYNDLNTIYTETCDDIEKIIADGNNYNLTKNELEKREITLSKQLESESTRLYFENEKVQQLNAKAEATIRKTEADGKLTKVEADITNIKAMLTDYNDYLTSLLETDQLEADIKDLNNTLDVYSNLLKEKQELSDKKKELEDNIATYSESKTTITKEIPALKAVEISINSLNKNLEELNKTFANYTTIKNALDPKSGIPLIFIQAFLDSTETIANELLNIAYNGKFEIKFIPTAKDFFIQVKNEKDGVTNVIEDIKIASGGETSLTTISISLALIERAIGNYNIMYLDEIDGPLDSKYRDSFIDILNKQIEKLGLEQVFVISHNQSFDTCSANLILLKDNDVNKNDAVYMSNKEIIYEVA